MANDIVDDEKIDYLALAVYVTWTIVAILSFAELFCRVI
jgi:hypothetical protein